MHAAHGLPVKILKQPYTQSYDNKNDILKMERPFVFKIKRLSGKINILGTYNADI